MTASAARANERVLTRDFSVGDGAELVFRAYHGAVRVNAGDPHAIRIEAHITTGPLSDAEFAQALQRFRLQADSDGRRVVADATGPRVHFLWQEKENLEIVFQIAVPPRCNVRIDDENGSVTVGDLEGSATVRTQRGTVYLKHIHGNIDASTTAAALVVSRCGGDARLRDESGDIRIGPVEGALDAATASGDIDAQMADGPATLYASSGDITLGLPKRIGGTISVRTNGGDIALRLNPAAPCTVQASSVWGDVVVEGLPVQVREGGNHRGKLTGALNGGGVIVTLHADGGHVDIKPSRT